MPPQQSETNTICDASTNHGAQKRVVFSDEADRSSGSSTIHQSTPDDIRATEQTWSEGARIYEYGSAANPDMNHIPVLVHPSELHEKGSTRSIPFDVSQALAIDDAPCTSPNLMASFLRVNVGDGLGTHAPNATSQAFYVIRGSGTTTVVAKEQDEEKEETISWSTGDLFCYPCTRSEMVHVCTGAESHGGAALYWVHDEPLMNYLGATPTVKKFDPTLYKRADMLRRVDQIRHETGECHTKNRLGVLLGNARCEQTKTLTHVLWSLLNSLPAHTVQRPHRHNSVALDLCVSAPPSARGSVYTLMGKEIDHQGFIVDPIRCDWSTGSVFITPPGWWHSHHNESDDVAWVLPVQDAGLYTHQRTLDIRFVDDEIRLYQQGRIRGTAFAITNKQYTEMVSLGAQVPERDDDDDDKAAGLKRIISAECLHSMERQKCTQIGKHT